jgi:hypothetical protein
MPKQTFQQTRENEEKKQYQFESLLKLTRAYQQFLQKSSGAVEKEIEDYIAFQNGLGQEQKGKGEFDPESSWIFRFFCWSPQARTVGKELGRRMGYTPTELSVRVISDAGYFMTLNGKVHPECAPILKDGRLLTLELDLSESKEVLYQQIEFFLNALYPQVKRLPKKRGGKVLERKDIEKMIRAYELVEKHGDVTEAAKELFPEISDYKSYQLPAKSKIEQVRRWHAKVKNLIKDL